MKLFVIGHGRHGKDLISSYMSEKYNLSFASSSEFIGKKIIYPKYKKQLNYSSWLECFNDRHNHRKLWFDEICRYNENDQSRLAKNIFAEHSIYCGLRNPLELMHTLIDKEAPAIDAIIWVDRSEHLPPEPIESSRMTPDHATHFIDNNGSIEQTHKQIDKLMSELIERKRK